MSTSESLLPGGVPATKGPKRSRFAGERLGAWVFAASFSIGIWGLALKIMTPTHHVPVAASPSRYAILAPSDAADGKAAIVWADAVDTPIGYPVTDAVPVMPLNPVDAPNGPGN